MTTYACATRDRAEALRAANASNGIDYLEVEDGPGVVEADRQRKLRVYLLNDAQGPLTSLSARNVVIEGGTRVRGIQVKNASVAGSTVTVEVDRPGDFSVYTLRLVGEGGGPLAGVDQRLASVDFSFKVDCPADFDCDLRGLCSHGREAAVDTPEIDYLARDYQGFRQLLLDRLAVLAPDWTERNPADLGIAIVEALAYSADHLTYRQDAVAMEATLESARRRTSARRHARLVDYRPHDGSNARTWVQVGVADGAGGTVLAAHTMLFTRVPDSPRVLAPDSPELRDAEAASPTVFETMEAVTLQPQRAEMPFYLWGEPECTLPAGATSATLRGHRPLAPGDAVVLTEECGPVTGKRGDADPEHRHAVRLIRVAQTEDEQSAHVEGATAGGAITEIEWDAEDALPFALCLGQRTEDGVAQEVSLARGNIVLADHGRTVQIVPGIGGPPVEPYTVPGPDPRLAFTPGPDHDCGDARSRQRPARYSLTLPFTDLTMTGTIGHAAPGANVREWAAFDDRGSAAAAFRWKADDVRPAVRLVERATGREWLPTRDLLGTNAFLRDFVVELEADGRATIRFGDGEYGARPRAGTVFEVRMRRGNGPAGNIGRGSIGHVVTPTPGITGATNLVPARGGTRAEPIERTRQHAPAAFFVAERAVTAEDYATMAERHPEVQRAVATERYTGGWYTVFLTVDRHGGGAVDARFERELRRFLEKFRMAGHDLEIDGPRFIALEVVLRVCVLPEYYRADVRQALLTRLGRGRRQEGGPAFFHPDEFTFGQPVTLSALLAAAHGVEGVHLVEPIAFQRRGDPRGDALRRGELTVGRMEIARLDNDPSFVERGTLELRMEGGR
ncbi:putative baseplate assembly protein [Microbacterium oryzae]|uniref:Putative baseplate assembly protein n=1 Tax=Microbacterium oryzae TaxID=743009 RepID=A0A6I6DZF5_9MICO|nr:putative baseplate assembly protein [Microbacterium oryzae]QGU27019.1 putative baseplate assembly protein [Microbacterium oryzae]